MGDAERSMVMPVPNGRVRMRSGGRIGTRRIERWLERVPDLTTPTLILHGARDDSVPLRLSQALRAARPDLVDLATFDAGHTLCWNADPDRWHETMTAWLKARVPR